MAETTKSITRTLVYSLLVLSTSLFLAVSGQSSEQKDCSEKERVSLLEFKVKLNDSNGILSSWTEGDSNCCGWKGISCDDSGVVVMLDLRNPYAAGDAYDLDFYSLGLSGEIDPTLLSLRKLRHLDLSGNDFSASPFPSFIGSFKDLRYLDLSTTNVYGVVPSRFGKNLTSLEFLDLSYNSGLTLETTTKGSSFLTHLSSLQYIDMSGTNLSINILDLLQELNSLPSISVIRLNECFSTPQSISQSRFPQLNFKNLTVLAVNWNTIFREFKIPDWLFKIDTLEYLDLQHTNFDSSSATESSFIPSAIGDLYKLKFLDLSYNYLGGSIPDSIGNLSLLEEIHLTQNNLVGSIPESIGRGLLSMTTLDFSRNQLVGGIPESLGRIRSLRQLDLSYNTLSGPIPRSIGNLSSLEQLNLQYNELTGPIPGYLKLLESLMLSKNRFNGSIPASLCSFKFLRRLDFSDNSDINGTVPDCVWGMEQIQILGIGGKGLQGVLSESHFSKLPNLRWLTITASKSLILNMSQDWIPPFSLSHLNMHSCKVGPKFPLWIRTQDNLISLILEDVGLSETPPVWIWNFSSRILNIQMPKNEMKGKLPDATYAPKLFYINLSYNKLEGSNWFSSIWKMMPNMEALSFAVNNFSGTIPSSLCKIDWYSFDVSVNSFSGRIPGCLMEVHNYLNLASNNLSGSLTVHRDSQCTLQYLNMEDNRLTGVLPEWLQNCRNLTILNLGINKLTGDIPTWVADSMSSLRILDLSCNKLHGRMPPSVMNFKAMQNHSTKLTDTLTIRLPFAGKLIEMPETIQVRTSIDLSSNELSGEIPEDIGSLQGLQSLNLSGNHITGNIPETISRLKALEKLDLSRNDVSGEIPQSMSSLTALNYLNLSFNNLSGVIPTRNQFSTFTDPSIFMGNPNLCGFPYRSCDSGQTLIPGQEHKDKIDMWVYLNTILGFIVGFWLFYGTLFFKKTWRHSYFQALQDFNVEVHLRCIRVWKKVSNKTK